MDEENIRMAQEDRKYRTPTAAYQTYLDALEAYFVLADDNASFRQGKATLEETLAAVAVANDAYEAWLADEKESFGAYHFAERRPASLVSISKWRS